jgi:hypothetical protein
MSNAVHLNSIHIQQQAIMVVEAFCGDRPEQAVRVVEASALEGAMKRRERLKRII